MRLRRAGHLGDQRIQIARRVGWRRRQPRIARGQRFEIREARIDGLTPLGVDRRQRRGVVPLDLRQVAHDVAQRDQSVLDVVIDLASQVADGGAVFGLAHAGRAACAVEP